MAIVSSIPPIVGSPVHLSIGMPFFPHNDENG